MDYRGTLNLPKTSFPMKANLVVKEKEWLKKWNEMNAYKVLREKRKGAKKYILHDGPPYSNGNVHMGTAMNKILKDIVVRSKSMQGYDSAFVPGWDNHGLPIEINVLTEARKANKVLTPIEMRKKCREFAKKFTDIQRKEFIRLGGWGEWENPYLTMDPIYESKIVEVFGELAEGGYIYRGLRPIDWCPTCETALAEAEIEYKERQDHSIFVRFPLKDDPKGIFTRLSSLASRPSNYVLVWTTTPWTIPANLAVAVHPDYDYGIVETKDGDFYLLAERLIPNTMEIIGVGAGNYKIVKKLKGNELEGLVFKHPLFDRASPVVFAEYVTLEDGTGVVHTAPGHGQEDFETGKKYGLDILCPVNESGRFTKEAGEKYVGLLTYTEGNEAVLKDLKENGTLLYSDFVSHQYPHCWRCKGPLLFRATDQWFISIDHKDLRKRALEEIEKVQWVPPETKNRISSMVQMRPDWCISRQRNWGVNLPIFFCKSNHHIIMNKETINYVRDIVAKESSDAWVARSAKELLPNGFKCPQCGDTEFEKETDILDVWFDSGSTHRAVLETRDDLVWPSDMYLEGSDQHRGWFNSSLIIAVATKGSAPYRTVVTHGWMLDKNGKPMHKSAGNAIEPSEITEKYGADILRLWVASTDYKVDVRLSFDVIEQIADAYRKIRNTFKYLLGNLYDFDRDKDAVPYKELNKVDKWILHRLQKLIQTCLKGYNEFDFHIVYHSIYNFCVLDLSSFYLDIMKDTLYTRGAKSLHRRRVQTVMYELLDTLVKLIAPILTFTAEEVWLSIPSNKDRNDTSIHYEVFPEVKEEYINKELDEKWYWVMKIRDVVLKSLEIKRGLKVIGNALEAGVSIYFTSPELKEKVKDITEEEWAVIFITSSVTISNSDSEFNTDDTIVDDSLGIKVKSYLAKGHKCERCWMYSETVGKNSNHPTICNKCVEAVEDSVGIPRAVIN